MNATKNQLARVIIMALNNMETVPAGDHPQVLEKMKLDKSALFDQYKLAVDALHSTHENTLIIHHRNRSVTVHFYKE